MRKFNEKRFPESCWNQATPKEMVFVLLGRDVAAGYAIRAWVRARIALGKNAQGDEQTTEALECADIMEIERVKLERELQKEKAKLLKEKAMSSDQ